MQGDNCIEVRNVFNLSVPYLTRFFGSAGVILRVDKDENSREVTIRFANRFSVDKALRFEGRILDKEPIRIRIAKPKNLPNDTANTASTVVALRRREHLANFKQALGGTGRFREDFWGIVFAEVRRCDFEEQGKLANALLLWRMGALLMGVGKHLQRHGINARSNYLLFQLERELIDRLDRRISSVEVGRQVGVEVREGRAWLWYSVSYPNTEEEQSKAEGYSSQSRCLQRIEKASAIVAHLIRGLYGGSLIFAPEEASVETVARLEWDWEGTGSAEDNFVGIIENIGVKDLVFDQLSYELPNCCLSLSEEGQRPQSFECSLRLVGCQTILLEERSWCDIFDAVVWKRWTSATEYYFHLQIKGPSERPSLAEHSLFFEEAHFSCENACYQYRKYLQLGLAQHARLYYVRKQRNINEPPQQQIFHQLYEDEVMNIQDEVLREQRVEPEAEGEGSGSGNGSGSGSQRQEGAFHEQVVVNVCLIEVRQQGQLALNQLKLQHYLLEYIEEYILGKGLIVASQEMAHKLAGNLIERENESRLFQFAHPRFKKHIGDELWRLYSRINERKVKNNLVHYQLGKK